MRRNCWRLCEIRDARQAWKFEAGSVLTKDELDVEGRRLREGRKTIGKERARQVKIVRRGEERQRDGNREKVRRIKKADICRHCQNRNKQKISFEEKAEKKVHK